MKRLAKRLARVIAFGLGAGIAFMGAGSIYELPAAQSAAFGATGAVLGLIMGLSFTYAGKGQVREDDFNSLMNDAIQSVQSKDKKDK